MKIVFFTENYLIGGLDTFIITLINNWPNPDDEIVFICNDSHPGILRYKSEINRENTIFEWHKYFLVNDFITAISKHVKSKIIIKIIRLIFSLFKLLLFFYHIVVFKKMLLKYNFNRLMVINGGYPGGLSCLAALVTWGIIHGGKKGICNFHNFSKSTSNYNFIENIIDKIIDNNTSYFVSVSKSAAESIRNRNTFKTSKKIRYIYNGVELSERKKNITSDLRNELLIGKKSKICLMLGTYEQRKGHLFILKVMKEVLKVIPDTHLIICGYGSNIEKTRVKGYSESLGISENVYLFDFRKDIDNLMLNSDILVIGSQKYESFGYTAVEAMSLKLPVVSTNVGGLKEVIKNGDGGFIFDKDDVFNYASKIVELLQNNIFRDEQGRKGHARVINNFYAKKMAEKYLTTIS